MLLPRWQRAVDACIMVSPSGWGPAMWGRGSRSWLVQACKEALAHTQAWKTNIGATVKKKKRKKNHTVDLRKLDEILLGTSKQRTLRHAFKSFENCPRPKKMLLAKLRSQTILRIFQSMVISNLVHLHFFSWRHPFSGGSWLAHGASQGPQELVPSLCPQDLAAWISAVPVQPHSHPWSAWMLPDLQ